LERNEKREGCNKQIKPKTDQRVRKVWLKTISSRNPYKAAHTAKQMKEHLPVKTAKEIRQKREEPSYKAQVQQLASNEEHSATPEPLESICSSSESETEIRPDY
jgi:hypothetical protein